MKLKEAHKRIMLLNHPDRGMITLLSLLKVRLLHLPRLDVASNQVSCGWYSWLALMDWVTHTDVY